MNLTRLLNAMSDCYTALRLAGWSADEASRIVAEQATKFINSLPIRPYPADMRGHDNATTQRHVPIEVDERQGP